MIIQLSYGDMSLISAHQCATLLITKRASHHVIKAEVSIYSQLVKWCVSIIGAYQVFWQDRLHCVTQSCGSPEEMMSANSKT